MINMHINNPIKMLVYKNNHTLNDDKIIDKHQILHHQSMLLSQYSMFVQDNHG